MFVTIYFYHYYHLFFQFIALIYCYNLLLPFNFTIITIYCYHCHYLFLALLIVYSDGRDGEGDARPRVRDPNQESEAVPHLHPFSLHGVRPHRVAHGEAGH